MNKNKKITLTPYADIHNYNQDYEVVSASIGFDGNVYVLLVDKTPEKIDGMFVQSKTNKKHTYKVLTLGEDFISESIIYNQRFNYHYVQPVDHDKFLLVGARTRYFDKDKYELNGKLFHADGLLLKEFLLGDGIQSVQVTRKGTIWTSYFDEGVFGNNGWSEPIGSPGLIAWNTEGEQIYRNTVAEISDCYALNVVSDDDVWFYYYTEFSLCHLIKSQNEFFNPKISGASGFLVYDNYFLFDKGYAKHDKYALLTSNSFKVKCTIQFYNESGQQISPQHRDFREDKLLLLENDLVFLFRLKDIFN